MTRRHPLADCEHCPLNGRPYVPSKFPQGQAKFAVIGESPGYQESLARRPFVGPSGRLMNEVLRKHDIDPNECYVSNAISCFPGNDVKPPKEALDACKPRLLAELAQSGASRVLAAGNFAAYPFLGTTTGITKHRVGPAREIATNGHKYEVVFTVHPAACLRKADDFPHFGTDVGKLKAKKSNWQKPKYKVVDTEAKALRYIQYLERFKTLAVDIETATEKDEAFDHPDDTEILCVGVAYDRAHAVVFPGDVLRIPIVGKLFGLLLAKSRIIAQNGKFDIPVLAQFNSDIRLASDSMLEHYVLDERGGVHKLEFMAMEFLGTPAWKWMTKQYTKNGQSFAAVPPAVLYEYNSIDCVVTYELDQLFGSQITQRDKGESLHEFLLRASSALMPVEREGVSIDLDYLQELVESYPAKLAALREPLQQWIDNPGSPAQVKSTLARFGIDIASTALPVLQELQYWLASVESTHPQATEILEFIQGVLDYRKAAKTYSTYVKGTRRRLHKGKIHTSYLLHATTTGRLSSRNPNLQNQPRGPEIRRLYVPSHPENVFVKADFAQGEWRVVTILAREPYFAERFAQGRDVVADLQEELFRDRTSKEFRTLTKNIAYGSWYGMILGRGKQGLYYAKHKLGMDPDEAYAYQHRLFELAANIPQWQERTRRRVLDGEILTSYKGRRRHFWLITPSNKHEVLNECLAYEPQSTLSDICLTALCELVEAGYAVRLSTHDEIVVECHADDAEHVRAVMAEVMSGAAKEFSTELPFPVETSVGKSWGDC